METKKKSRKEKELEQLADFFAYNMMKKYLQGKQDVIDEIMDALKKLKEEHVAEQFKKLEIFNAN